jgi:hypothetical protein
LIDHNDKVASADQWSLLPGFAHAEGKGRDAVPVFRPRGKPAPTTGVNTTVRQAAA